MIAMATAAAVIAWMATACLIAAGLIHTATLGTWWAWIALALVALALISAATVLTSLARRRTR